MREVEKDFWKIIADWKCIPTNGEVDREKKAIMGAGLARETAIRLPQFPQVLGKKLLLQENDPHVVYVGNWDYVRYYAFPTKYSWRNPSSLDLIEQSCSELLSLLSTQIITNTLDGRTPPIVVLPQVECGLGKLSYENEVRPLLMKFFEKYDSVVISLGK